MVLKYTQINIHRYIVK